MFRLIRLKIKKRMFPEPEKSLAGLLQGEKPGQALVVLAVAFFALLAFIGLVTDVGSIYVSYTSLQRAVDAAAVAAANNIKNPSDTYEVRHQRITEAAREMLNVHRVSGISDLQVYLCSDTGRQKYDEDGNPMVDAGGNPIRYVLPASFAAMCPQSGQVARKLAYIEATQDSPVYFLHIFGVQSLPLHVTAVGETAAVDLVIVIDTSESMASELNPPYNPGDYKTVGYNPRDYNPNLSPNGCNITNRCYPLYDAKVAAANLVANLFDGYDRVAIVTYNYTATLVLGLSDDLAGTVQNSIASDIRLHDDLDAVKVQWTSESPLGGYRTFNPIYPEDRDGDGKDADPNATCTDANGDLWDDTSGDPCDSDTIADTIDWNKDGVFDAGGAPGWYHSDQIPASFETTSILSTCSGCGIRVATETLQGSGRPGAVWVIVFLTDGLTNLSDRHATNPNVLSDFIYGFCGPTKDVPLSTNFWPSYCIDNASERYCIDDDPDQCPSKQGPLTFPNIIVDATTMSGPYSVEDYAFDMADRAGLTTGLVDTSPSTPGYNANRREPSGEDIVIFSVGLDAARDARAARLLHYIANIGDDGSRENDPCDGLGPTVSCGNYYYAPTGAYLSRIFENIAGRIFTKISR
jgi:hypothetical protein